MKYRTFTFSFYDGSIITTSGRAQVFKIFRAMSTRPDKFKMTFRKFKFFLCLGKPRITRFSADNVRLERYMFVETLRESRIISVHKIRERWRKKECHDIIQ